MLSTSSLSYVSRISKLKGVSHLYQNPRLLMEMQIPRSICRDLIKQI